MTLTKTTAQKEKRKRKRFVCLFVFFLKGDSWLQAKVGERHTLKSIFSMRKPLRNQSWISQVKPEDLIIQTSGAGVIWAGCHGALCGSCLSEIQIFS